MLYEAQNKLLWLHALPWVLTCEIPKNGEWYSATSNIDGLNWWQLRHEWQRDFRIREDWGVRTEPWGTLVERWIKGVWRPADVRAFIVSRIYQIEWMLFLLFGCQSRGTLPPCCEVGGACPGCPHTSRLWQWKSKNIRFTMVFSCHKLSQYVFRHHNRPLSHNKWNQNLMIRWMKTYQ